MTIVWLKHLQGITRYQKFNALHYLRYFFKNNAFFLKNALKSAEISWLTLMRVAKLQYIVYNSISIYYFYYFDLQTCFLLLSLFLDVVEIIWQHFLHPIYIYIYIYIVQIGNPASVARPNRVSNLQYIRHIYSILGYLLFRSAQTWIANISVPGHRRANLMPFLTSYIYLYIYIYIYIYSIVYTIFDLQTWIALFLLISLFLDVLELIWHHFWHST